MIYRTETREDKVYMIITSTDYYEPLLITSFWLTRNSPDIVPSGTILEKWMDSFSFYNGWKRIIVELVNPNGYPDFTEFIKAGKPKGKNWIWKCGGWIKS